MRNHTPFLRLRSLLRVKDPYRLANALPSQIRDSYHRYEEWEAAHGEEHEDIRVVAEGLTSEQAHEFILAVSSRAAGHPRMGTATLDRQVTLGWFHDAVDDPDGPTGFLVEVWAATADTRTWYVVDKSMGFGRYPWLWGYGWLPQLAR